jgi:hypothetical protein
VFGLGGVFVEVLQDTCIRMPPFSLEEASTMISALKGKSLFEGFRGRGRADTDALAYTLVQVGRMALDLKDSLISLDLNPLMVLPDKDGVRAVDVLIDAGDEEQVGYQEAVDVWQRK